MQFRFTFGLPIPGLIVFTIVAGMGCGSSTPPDKTSMMDQILGALQVQGKTQRDAALAEACRQSAEAGDGFAVLQGLPRIEAESLRNEVASECAEMLSDSGKSGQALDAANLITRQQQREELVEKLNSGT